MKKTLVALALCAAGTAQAQSSVTIYGVVDSGLVLENGGKNGSVAKISGGASAGSRIGFKGREDLGGGMGASFVLETGFNTDDGSLNAGGGIFGRQSYVGLDGGFGAVSVGRQYSLLYLAVNEVADPFKTGSAGRANNILQMAGTRINNAVRYTSPVFGGFNVNALYGAGEVAGREAAGRNLNGELAYANGPLAARLVYATFNDAPTLNSTPLSTTRSRALLGAYLIGALRLHAGYALNNSDGGLNSRDLLVGATYTLGSNRFATSIIYHNDRSTSDADVDQYALGVYHALSQRTELYGVIAYMRRKNVAAANTFFVGNASDTGTGNRGINLGVKHSF
ncbi:porin [Herbaspirillum sp. NPDC087042]|uniref:porin n=1 Tax=Herbaspirillum sp. NPDC087042 TaxID=3364004 RepID=UPI003809F96A